VPSRIARATLRNVLIFGAESPARLSVGKHCAMIERIELGDEPSPDRGRACGRELLRAHNRGDAGEACRTTTQWRRAAHGEQIGHAPVALDEFCERGFQISFGFQAGRHCAYMSLRGSVVQSIKIKRTGLLTD
jgi:hypothetical protein